MATIREALAQGVSVNYRTSPDDALLLVDEILAHSPALREAAKQEPDPQAIRRLRVYKDAAREAKRLAYKRLRVYKTDTEQLSDLTARLAKLPQETPVEEVCRAAEEIAGLHVSTRERLSALTEFTDYITRVLGSAETVLDVGCGLYPLLFPFPVLPAVRHYVAADSDEASVEALQAFARHMPCLVPRRWNIADGWGGLAGSLAQPKADVAFLFKVIPVVARQRKASLSVLAQTPATRWLVTGSTVSMTKRRSIARRERGALHRFIADAGRTVLDERIIGEELVLMV
ncbi:MAG: hypothetical protein HN742_33910 [Lentisphaerae bacterium]|nr:hypothetical protein [Lentisphaerota bacterium]MBT4815696.1 hypothetical protein [Lentisphaerota bacterium]MBT5611460.1 hypothetical protein [Lentisphaerota bacterium]MBT7061009.1 hypothetical protein [Lentisphaerota bacterium]MBT7846917.1 hypothetical protein [Lentisphaerota bacterium]